MGARQGRVPPAEALWPDGHSEGKVSDPVVPVRRVNPIVVVVEVDFIV